MKFCTICSRYVEPGHAHEIETILPTSFKFERGRKNEHGSDFVMFWNGIKVTIEQIGIMVGFLYRNEDSIYPPSKGFEGGKRLQRFINACMEIGYPTREIMKKFFLK